MRNSALVTALLCLASGSAAALYNPAPDPSLAAVQGEWIGTLTYRDYSQPDKMVTLPTRVFIALGAPSELVLHFVYDDGPSKTVYSYERMQFDFAANELTWSSLGEEDATKCRIGPRAPQKPAGMSLTCEHADKSKVERYTFVLTPERLAISKEEIEPSGTSLLRNQYSFSRAAASPTRASRRRSLPRSATRVPSSMLELERAPMSRLTAPCSRWSHRKS